MSSYLNPVRREHPPGQPRGGARSGRSGNGRLVRATAAVLAPLVSLGAGIVVAQSAAADVRAPRTIEVFHGRNIVAVDNYPAETPVTVEVFRGAEKIGFATYTTDANGFFEINHLGGGDCWQSPYTPDVRPGDVVRTTTGSETTQDFSVTRDVFINLDAEFLPGNVIRLTGHAKGTADAPMSAGDIVELRMNKVSRTNGWETNGGRRDLRLADVLPFTQPDGTYTYDFTVSEDDWNDAQTTGIDISTVWIRGSSELTFYDGEPEATQGCPPLMPDDRTAPTPPTTVSAVPVGTDGVRVTWSGANDDVAVTGYNVLRDGVKVGSTTVTATNDGLVFNDGPLATGTYTYTIEAVDATPNTSVPSSPASVTVGTATVPDAPTNVQAAPGNNSAAVTWTAPANDGGSDITGYVVRYVTGTTVRDVTLTGTATSTTLTGLTNGTQYTVSVATRTSVGLGAFSSPGVTVTPTAPPAVAPGAPTNVTATGGDSAAQVSWTAPTDDGGAAITGYKVRVFNGTTEVGTARDAASSPFAVTGLTNGTAYTIQVAAVNSAGTGTYAASTPVTPRAASTVPTAPTLGTLTSGNARVTVRWTAPASNGGSAVTGYTVRTYHNGTLFSSTPAGSTAISAVVTGLTNGTPYTFDVVATNANGTSPASAMSAPTTPYTTPGAPTIGSATAGNTSATVNWTAPASDGGSPITSYQVQVRTGTTVVRTITGIAPTPTSTDVTGLTNGTAYNFRVRAVNAVGNGTLSTASAAVTPRATSTATAPAAPAAPTAVAGNGSATVSWTAPADGGSAITGYQLRVFSGTAQVGATRSLGNVTSTTVTGLTNGTAYTFDVAATNAVGTGTFSPRSAAVTPRATTTSDPAPTVSSRTPAANAFSVTLGSNITATFSEAVTGVDTSTFVVTNPAGTRVAALVTRDGTTNRYIFNPDVNMTADTRYTVTLNGAGTGIKDAAGQALATTSWSFTTGPAPGISSRSPGSGATGINRNANVTVTFNEAVANVTDSTFVLRNTSTGVAIGGAVTRNGTTNQWILNPGVTLAASTQYTVSLVGGTSGITDLAGNPLGNPTWNFTTGTAT